MMSLHAKSGVRRGMAPLADDAGSDYPNVGTVPFKRSMRSSSNNAAPFTGFNDRSRRFQEQAGPKQGQIHQ